MVLDELVELLEPNVSVLDLPEPVLLHRLCVSRCFVLDLLAGLVQVRQVLLLGDLVPTLEVEHIEDLVRLDNLKQLIKIMGNKNMTLAKQF